MLVASACSGSSKADEPEGGGGAGEGKPGDADPGMSIVITPGDGAENVATSEEFQVTAEGGTLTEVSVVDPEGEEVVGEFSEDQAGWQPTEHLANGITYAVTASGTDDKGEEVSETAGFSTVAADATFDTMSLLWNWIEDGGTVGVGTVVSITFDTPIENTAAVRDAIEIVTEPAVEVRGHWFGNQRLDFRPEDYWEPGTDVTLKFRTRGVEGAPGVYGTRYNERSFTVGRSQVSTVDVATLEMDVVRNGEKLKTVPVTAGSKGQETWNGKMVVSEKFEELRMDGATVGYDYDVPDVPHAMRLSNSGTFVHGNYWSSDDTFGNRLDTHGCIGLKDVQGANDKNSPGAWFYQESIIGDVVEVINSNDDIIAPDNGINGWNMSWSQWGAGQ
jgi:lipoprotein-anchoring transpeptidase ErfK/SrfK